MTHWKRTADFGTVEGRALWQLVYSYRNYLDDKSLEHAYQVGGRWGLADLYSHDARGRAGEVRVLVEALCGMPRPRMWVVDREAFEAYNVRQTGPFA